MTLRLAGNWFAFAILAQGSRMNAQLAGRDCRTSKCAPAEQVLATQIDSLRLARGIPGLAVVILGDTSVVFAKGFGFAVEFSFATTRAKATRSRYAMCCQ
ncbi:MAG: hypothetical protein ABJB66_16220 [Gemmatimonadaceae bacterium]